jgi:hypothetical protein
MEIAGRVRDGVIVLEGALPLPEGGSGDCLVPCVGLVNSSSAARKGSFAASAVKASEKPRPNGREDCGNLR